MNNKLTLILAAFIAMVLCSSCNNELDVTQSFPFTVETMPVPKDVKQGETVEIRCTLTSEGDYSGIAYTIRYFQI